MTVNEGVTTVWALAMAGILLATGWKRQLLDDVSASRAVLTAAALFAACGFGHAAAPRLAAFLCASLLLRNADAVKRLQALFGALPASLAWIGLRKLYADDPVFILWDERLDGALAAGLLAGAAAGHFRAQFAAVTFAAIASDLLGPAPAGPWGWLDGLAASLLAARAVALLVRGGEALAGRPGPQA